MWIGADHMRTQPVNGFLGGLVVHLVSSLPVHKEIYPQPFD